MSVLEPDHPSIRQQGRASARLFFTLAASVMAAVSPALASDPFLGTWVGDVREQGQDSTYTLRLTIFERNDRLFQNVEYGSPMDCEGGGVLIDRAQSTLHLSEFITRNRYQCADGSIRLYLNGEDRLIWEWFTPAGEYVARADLVPEK